MPGHPSMNRGTYANDERLAVRGCSLVLFIYRRYAGLSTEALEVRHRLAVRMAKEDRLEPGKALR